ncbi:calcium-activated chloride channel regulator 1-like isoform X1 [Dermacentor albipictus]|uniref:calcium-activated chloride channel regulator 1-like isoform X1 n=1 Tax=Dermacentor albipictus TaxID=60249 RepID=UPI0038FBFB6A
MYEIKRLLLAAVFLSLLCSPNGVRIENDGGYVDVLASIHEDVKENETIVTNLKVLLRSWSSFLRHATGGLVYIKQVYIRFPKTWELRSGARNEPYSPFAKSDLRVQNLQTDKEPDQFSTKLRKLCGYRGDFMRLSSRVLEELNTAKDLKSATYRLVHEWAHYRYGVFYEYGRFDSTDYPVTYCKALSVGNFILNGCSEKIDYNLIYRSQECDIEKHCHLRGSCDMTYSLPRSGVVDSSIMFLPYLENITHFCSSGNRNREHNIHAPNMHNRLCRQKSTWDIIKENKDFKGLRPLNMGKKIEVDIVEIQQKPGMAVSAVLALDVSTSMHDYQRLETVKEAVDRFLWCLRDNIVTLAIVTFSTTAEVRHPMVVVNETTLKGFQDVVRELQPSGYTCIGCALKLSLEVLKSSKQNADASLIVLLTDGQENQQPSIEEVSPELSDTGIAVRTMAMGDEAEETLEELAAATKGKSYFFPDRINNPSRAYIEVLTSHAHKSTHHLSGLTTFNETAKAAAMVPIEGRDDTTSLYDRNFMPPLAAIKANAEMSYGDAPNHLRDLGVAERAEIFDPANSECFQQLGHDLSIIMQMAFVDSINADVNDSLNMITVMLTTKNFTRTLEETFMLDGDLGSNTVIIVARLSPGSSSLSTLLVDPTGQSCENCQEEDRGLRKTVTIPSPATPGAWIVRVLSSSEEQVMVNIMVMSQARDLKQEPIVVTCEMSDQVVSTPEEAIILADLRKGEKVVLDATVTAMVVSQTDLSCPVQLRDDGKDPDIFANDGTYSAYFTRFTGGSRYSVMAYVYGGKKTKHAYRRLGFPYEENITFVNNPVGISTKPSTYKLLPTNYVPTDTLLQDFERTPPFQRVAIGASFKVKNNLVETDVPPGCIWDLKTAGGHVELDRTPIVTLTWTWPGARMTDGKAAALELRGGTDEDRVFSDFDSQELMSSVVDGNLEPLPAGSKHMVTISLPRRWETAPRSDDSFYLTAYLAARVVNADGLKSKRSNVVRVMFEIENITTSLPRAVSDRVTTVTSTCIKPAQDQAITPTAEVGNEREKDKTSVYIWIVLLAVAAVVFMSISIMLLLKSRSNNLQENEENTMKTQTTTMESSWLGPWPPWEN